jgi:hypothetical protein
VGCAAVECPAILPEEQNILERFVSREGCLHLNHGIGNGKYRVIGEVHNFPLVEHVDTGLGVAVDIPLESITLYLVKNNAVTIVLPYKSMTNDVVAATFSDDGTTLAIAETRAVTFYANKDNFPQRLHMSARQVGSHRAFLRCSLRLCIPHHVPYHELRS